MDGKRIIPCVTMDNPVAEAKFYNDTGADAVAFFDSNASREGLEKNIPVIKEIAREVDIPIIACGGVRRLEDVKKLLYAGASKVCMKSAPLDDISIVKEASDRFGSDRIIVTIDLTECEDPVTYGKALKEAGAGEILLVHYGKLNHYNDYVKEVKKEVGLPIIVSSFSTDGAEIAELLKDTEAETISLYNLQQHDVMQLKQACAAAGVPVNLYESAVPFSEFKKDDKGLVPCIVQDYKTKDVLMMAYMNEESFAKTLETGRMTYFSRSRNELWVKGLTSGHFQYVKEISADCDKDTLLAKVRQIGAACHTGSYSCFFNTMVHHDFDEKNPYAVLKKLYDVVIDRKKNPKEGSYTNYLFDKGIDKILKKCGEEATEMVIAAKNPGAEELKYEIADLMYHMTVLMAECGIDWDDVMGELANR